MVIAESISSLNRCLIPASLKILSTSPSLKQGGTMQMKKIDRSDNLAIESNLNKMQEIDIKK